MGIFLFKKNQGKYFFQKKTLYKEEQKNVLWKN
jgi:hypothetical protein